MSYDSLLINTCNVLHRTLDKWGKVVSITADIGIKCRIEYKNRLLRNFKGEEVMSYAIIFFRANAPIGQNDRIILDGREWSPVRIERQQDSIAIHHQEVYVY